VTGVLPIGLEDARKVTQALLSSGKEYVCIARLHRSVPEKEVRTVLNLLQGTIYQRPPLRSSVKRRLRTRMIYYIHFLEMKERNLLFKIGCQSGTYIRKICFDVGEILGAGAHMLELRRTRAGPFTEDEGLTTLYDLLYAHTRWRETGEEETLRRLVHPMERALELVPKIYIRDSAVAAVCHGAAIAAPGVLSIEEGITENSVVAIMTQKGEAVAFAKTVASTDQIVSMSRGFIAEVQRVVMRRDTYPKMWSRSNT
jgi:H/ACA ribonucleoprotein complex subunit 4